MQSAYSVYQHMLRYIPAHISMEASLLGAQGSHHVLETTVPPITVAQLRALISHHKRSTDAIPSGGASSDAKQADDPALYLEVPHLHCPQSTADAAPWTSRSGGSTRHSTSAVRVLLWQMCGGAGSTGAVLRGDHESGDTPFCPHMHSTRCTCGCDVVAERDTVIAIL